MSTARIARKPPVMALLTGLVGSLASLAAHGQSRPGEDPTLSSNQMQLRDQLRPCEEQNLSNVEKAGCLSRQAGRLRTLLRAEHAKALASADPGEPAGDAFKIEAAKKLRADMKAAQKAWEAYTKAQCNAVVGSFELHGGSGGAVEAGYCRIRHLVQRINEPRGGRRGLPANGRID